MRGCTWGMAFSLLLWALIAVIVMGLCSVASVVAEDEAVGHARAALYYLDGHLPGGQRIPPAMLRDGPYVLACENRELDARAVSETGDIGVWQISAYWQRKRLAQMGLTVEDLYDPHLNTVVAIAIWEDRGWGAWSCGRTIR